MAHLHELMCNLGVTRCAAELADWLAIPIQTQPLEPVDQCDNGSFG